MSNLKQRAQIFFEPLYSGSSAKSVFTLPGMALSAISFVIFVRSLINKNVYEITLSLLILFLLAVLFFAGKRNAEKLAFIEPFLKPPVPLAALSGEEWLVTIPSVSVPLFFRIHFLVKGKFFPQGSGTNSKFLSGCPVFAETSIARGETQSAFSLGFPLGGNFSGEGFCRLQDIFGFFSFSCGKTRKQSLPVRNAPPYQKAFRIDAQTGAEERRNKNSAEEERYYMREYAPGDRYRDINWKSSEKIDSLITRISPDNQDKITRLEINLRNYGPSSPTLNELWLLDRIKARLAWFLRSVKEEKPSFIFHISAAQTEWEITEHDQLESFLDEIAGLPFSPDKNSNSSNPDAEQKKGELYIFSTACDAALQSYLLSLQSRSVSLFVVQNPNRENYSRDNGLHNCDLLYLHDFIKRGSIPLPKWLLIKNNRQGAGGIRAMTDYAETRL